MSALLLERDRRVLRDIIAIIRPRGSLAAKLETLTDEQRAHYEYYSERMSAFIARNDIDPDGNPGNAYAMTLRNYGPRLPETISRALFGGIPRILKTDSENDADRKWMEYYDAQR